MSTDHVYDWQADGALPGAQDLGGAAWTAGPMPPQQPPTPPRQERHRPQNSRARETAGHIGAAAGQFVGAAASGVVPNVTLNVNGGGQGGGAGRGGTPSAGPAPSGARGDFHQGDNLIAAIERIEITSDADLIALAKAVLALGRELHLILGMRAEEVQALLGSYKGRWYTFGASSKVKARLVAAHLKISAEAAKALGVGGTKLIAAFNKHFVIPEQEERRRQQGGQKKQRFTIGGQ